MDTWGDTIICNGNSTTIRSDTIVNWVLASKPDSIIAVGDSIVLSPTFTTTYIAFNAEDIVEFTIHVIEQPTPLNLRDTALCKGDTLLLNAQTAPYTGY